MIDIIFYIDMILMFLTSVTNKYGREVFDSFEIAVSYTSQFRFYIDFFSLLGTFPFASISYLQPFGILKSLRVMRISEMIRKSTLTQDSKACMEVLKLILYLTLYIHLVGCLLWT